MLIHHQEQIFLLEEKIARVATIDLVQKHSLNALKKQLLDQVSHLMSIVEGEVSDDLEGVEVYVGATGWTTKTSQFRVECSKPGSQDTAW